MQFHPLASALVVAPLLLGLPPLAQDLAFHPRQGSELPKRFTIKTELAIGTVIFEAAGQDLSSMVPSDMSFGLEAELELVDHYVDMEGDRPRELAREFRHFRGSYHALEEQDSIDRDLEGARIRFVWNDEAKRYDVSAPTGETAPEQVQALLGIDMDYRSLLPAKSVNEGDTWSIDKRQLGAALLPGVELDGLGAMEVDPEDAEGIEILRKYVLPELSKLGEKLETTCKLAGAREIDGRELAVVELRVQCDSSVDLSEFVMMAMREGGEIAEDQVDLEAAELLVKLQGQGELLWDFAAGHVHSFELDAKLELELRIDASVSEEGQDAEVHFEGELLGNSRWTMAKP